MLRWQTRQAVLHRASSTQGDGAIDRFEETITRSRRCQHQIDCELPARAPCHEPRANTLPMTGRCPRCNRPTQIRETQLRFATEVPVCSAVSQGSYLRIKPFTTP